MKHLICSKYLVFPVHKEAAVKRLTFWKGEEAVYELNIRLDNLNPDFYSYIDVSRFKGEELEITVDPGMPLCFTTAEEMTLEGEYGEPLRPKVHFTTKNGWNNDPNGLVYMDGRYHLFYQYNPCAPQWNNMHWGHAVSRDLLHWEEKDIALFPDETGTMYSGSAIPDEYNLLGLNTEKQKAMLLFYTVTKPPRKQCMAYSLDSGETFIKYEGNPIVPHIEAYNRDPKVVWCEEMNCYIMALYLDQDRYGLLESKNLKEWTLFQQVALAGDSECPDLFCLRDSDGNRRWVLMGASDKYLVGKFEKQEFVPLQTVRSLHYGKINYAAQSYDGISDRVVRIAWNKLKVDGGRFSQQMGFPTEMSLEKLAGEYYLCARPVREIGNLYLNEIKEENLRLSERNAKRWDVEAAPLLISLKADAAFSLSVFGGTITVDPERNELRVLDSVGPLSLSQEQIELTVLIDRCSMEVYADGGKICFVQRFVCDYNLPFVELIGEGEITEIEMHTLKSIWEQRK